MTTNARKKASPSVIARCGIISPGSFSREDPRRGLDETLDLFTVAENIGYQTAGIRQRHLEHGSSSALALLAASTQRTKRITLETNVVPLSYEIPFRLAEDFSTVAALAGNRLTVGISTSAPHAGLLEPLHRTDASSDTNPYQLIERFLTALRGKPLGEELIPTPYGTLHQPSVNPYIPDLINQVWLGAGSDRSTVWAAERGLGIFLGNLTDAVGDEGFEVSQRARIDLYLREYEGSLPPRIAVERVILPLDSATEEQQAHYREFAEGRLARTKTPQGERRTVIQPDLIGTSEEIIELLRNDPAFDGRTELRVSLPYAFAPQEYIQIITDIAELVLPSLGWDPDISVAEDLDVELAHD